MTERGGNVTYDPEADAMYLYLQKGPIVDTDIILPGIIVDFGEEGRVVGIEWLFRLMNDRVWWQEDDALDAPALKPGAGSSKTAWPRASVRHAIKWRPFFSDWSIRVHHAACSRRLRGT